MATEKVLPIPQKEHRFVENVWRETYAESAWNTGIADHEANIMQNHKKAEAPKTAASAVLKASLGEDKYFILSFDYNPIITFPKKFIHQMDKKILLFQKNIIY